MNILVIGNEANRVEMAQKFGSQYSYALAKNLAEQKPILEWAEVIFDFVSASAAHTLVIYDKVLVPVFLDTTFTSLATVLNTAKIKKQIIGFCGLPTFAGRDVLEVCIVSENDYQTLKEACEALNTKFSLVQDQTGFVTPRIICMIINEAYFTVAEGTATRQDIDLAMKLGTNYPFGPFEWGARIGVQNVVKILDAVYQTSANERYKVCSLMREEGELVNLPLNEGG